jgi:hypothetical protein
METITDAPRTNEAIAALLERDGELSEENAPEVLVKLCRQLERERDDARLDTKRWKSNHDNQVKLKQIISDRPDLKERAKLVAELIEERDTYWKQSDYLLKELGKAQERMIDAERERDGWREAAYSLAEAIPASWDELQPPAEQLRKFKEMVACQNKKTKEFLDNADKHSKMYP